jgi:predicted HicB family RNase H-like nuclease
MIPLYQDVMVSHLGVKMKKTLQKDAFTVRMDSKLYDKMRKKLSSYRKGKSINKYINELIEKDLCKEKYNEKN